MRYCSEMAGNSEIGHSGFSTVRRYFASGGAGIRKMGIGEMPTSLSCPAEDRNHHE